MKNILTKSLAIALTSAALLTSATAMADSDAGMCKARTDAVYLEKIQGNWHLDQNIDAKDKSYEMHISFSKTKSHGGQFHLYLNEINHKDNQMVTVDGNYRIHNGNIKTLITDSNVPVNKKHDSAAIVCMSDSQLTVNAGGKTATFDKDS